MDCSVYAVLRAAVRVEERGAKWSSYNGWGGEGWTGGELLCHLRSKGGSSRRNIEGNVGIGARGWGQEG